MKYLLPGIFCLAFTFALNAQKADTIIYERWVNNAWQNQFKSFFQFNANCDTSGVYYQNWNVSSLMWETYNRRTYTYSNWSC